MNQFVWVEWLSRKQIRKAQVVRRKGRKNNGGSASFDPPYGYYPIPLPTSPLKGEESKSSLLKEREE